MTTRIFEYVSNFDFDEELASELVKEAAFVSDHLSSFDVDLEKNCVLYSILGDDESIENEVRDKVERFVSAMAKGHRNIPSKSLISGGKDRLDSLERDVFKGLVSRGWVSLIGDGHISLAGPALKLFNHIDRIAADIYDKQFSPEPRHFPALLPAKLVAKCGYIESHPNNLSFVTHLKNDFDVIEGFRQKHGSGDDIDNLGLDAVAPPHVCLNPAACLPSYFTLQDKKLEESICLSWLGRVFRHESRNLDGLERLWEYNVRELVFIGEAESVVAQKDKAVGAVVELLNALDLKFEIQTSTDPFFATVSAIKKFWQKSMEAKHEVKLDVGVSDDGSPHRIAAGSINYHDTFFGTRFNITDQANEPVASACVGLGIERILLACFAQHGFDRSQWPENIQQSIF